MGPHGVDGLERPAGRALARGATRRLFPVGLALLVLVPCLVILVRSGFDGLYGQDPFAYYDYAIGPVRSAIFSASPPPDFFHWPPGYPLLVAVVSLVTGPVPLAGLIVSLLAGAIVPVATALLAYEVLATRIVRTQRERQLISLLAGVVAGAVGQLWQSSVVVMSDTTALAAATAGTWALARFATRRHVGWLVAAAVLLAASIVTRWPYGLVALPLAIAGLILLVRRDRLAPRRLVRSALTVALASTAVLLLAVGPMTAALLSGTPVPFAAEFGAHAWRPDNAFRSTFRTGDGILSYAMPTGLYYFSLLGQPYLFTPLLLPLVVTGAVVVARARELLSVAVLLAWPLLTLLFLVGLAHQNPRFILPVVPPLAILIALGAWRVVSYLGERRISPRAAGRVMVGFMALSVAGMLVGGSLLTTRFVARHQADKAATADLAARVPPDARILAFGPTLLLRHLRGPDVLELYDLQPPEALTLVADGRPTYLVLDPASTVKQWAGRVPATTLQAIETAHGLTTVARAGAYTLLRVGRS